MTLAIARLFDALARFVPVPWRRRAALSVPEGRLATVLRWVFGVKLLGFIVLWTPVARANYGDGELTVQRLFDIVVLVGCAEWLQGRSARLTAWVSFAGMALSAFYTGAFAVEHAALGTIVDALHCAGYVALGLRAAADDAHARRENQVEAR